MITTAPLGNRSDLTQTTSHPLIFLFSMLKKDGWDRWLELKIMNNEDYTPVLSAMVAADVLPDESSMIRIIEAYRKNGNIQG